MKGNEIKDMLGRNVIEFTVNGRKTNRGDDMSAILRETLLRTGITTADAAVPTIKQLVADLTGSPFATVAFSITGQNASFTVYPLLWNKLLGKYMLGDYMTITMDTEYNIAVNGTTDLYMYVSEVSGTTPSLDIVVKPAIL